jgi:hypothetical protein
MSWRKTLAVAVAAPILLVGSYVGFLWATYISETTTSGAAYGFTIGSNKAQSAAAMAALRREHPKAAVYVSYGRRAGDHFTVPASMAQLNALAPHDRWKILLHGPSQFHDSIRLTFQGDTLVSIYRHRQHFELP